jgi:hypothetical protein
LFISIEHHDPAIECFDALLQNGIYMAALQMCGILGVIRLPRRRRTNWKPKGRVAAQIDSAEYVATFIVDRELCWEAQAAGKLPASIVVASHYSKMIYDMRRGGGGNCTRVPRSACRRPELDHRSWGELRLGIKDGQIPVPKHSAAVI